MVYARRLVKEALRTKGETLTNYQPSERLKNYLKSQENCAEWNEALGVFMPYADSGGISTIGWGHRLTHVDINSGIFNYGLSQLGCDRLFEQDLSVHIKFVNNIDLQGLTQGQFDALVDLSYNAGFAAVKTVQRLGLQNAPSTFMTFVHDKHGNELKGLVKRRKQDVAWWSGAAEGSIA